MLNGFASILGSVLLAIGICSPALGSVNKHSATLVFFGLALIAVSLYSDSRKDRQAR